MIKINRINNMLLLTACALFFNTTINARPTISNTQRKVNGQGLMKTAAGCTPATATIDLDINNVRAKLMTGGDMWWDIGTGEARYEVPINSRKSSLFAGSVWIGGIDAQGQLKVAAQTYRQSGNDYWPGPLNGTDLGNVSIDAATCADWDRFWKINSVTLNRFRELQKQGDQTVLYSSEFQSIYEWPARGNGAGSTHQESQYQAHGTSNSILAMDDRGYAPFVDVNDDGEYSPLDGDYPKILGDQYIWWVFNDKGNVKGQTRSESIGMEVQASAFAFSAKNAMNDATFYNYRLINRSLTFLDSTFISVWTDADLGDYRDDYIGCDTSRDLGILYNGDNFDGTGSANEYGAQIPMVAVDFFVGPIVEDTINGVLHRDTLGMEAFTYYNNTSTNPAITDPDNAVQFYYYMTGSLATGQRFKRDFNGPGTGCTGLGNGPDTKVVFDGDPENKNQWSECACGNAPADRRFIHSSGPFKLQSGASNDVTTGVVWAANTGGCNETVSFRKIRAADDLAQQLFESGFKAETPPEAPRLVIRELDQRLVCYLVNDATSNNYKEQYGFNLDSAKYRQLVPKARRVGSTDTLYKFEGYRVFQLKNSEVTAAQIVDERGEVNTDLAKEVFQCDIKNGVTQLVNYEKATDIEGCDNCYRPSVKVTGKDQGIVHSFEIVGDAFATTSGAKLANYKTYYYIAVAYATNNFAHFDPNNAESTQDRTYFESEKGAGGLELKIVQAMPNPTNGTIGNTLNTAYGDGVIVKKLTGIGNGRMFTQLSAESEEQALTTSFATQPTYVGGAGPVGINVVDPLKIVPGNWELYVNADTSQPAPYTNGSGLLPGKSIWWLIKDGNQDTVYSERNLDEFNEQILEQYGLSIDIQAGRLPGSVPDDGNGYIGSDIIFENRTVTWLGGLVDGEAASPFNWIRSGQNYEQDDDGCNYSDVPGPTVFLDPQQDYENMLSNSSTANKTWAPYALGVRGAESCGLETATEKAGTSFVNTLSALQSVDVVYTADRSKWTRCVVIEMEPNIVLAEGRAPQFSIRRHKSWTGNVDGDGQPIYGSLPGDPIDTGMSWFPGYAINQETGERLNIVFSEDSWLKADNGSDMIWNPSSRLIDDAGNNLYAGKHYVYVTKSRYDSAKVFATQLSVAATQYKPFESFIWTSIPSVNTGYSLLSLRDGIIPTTTRIRLRVERPYNKYVPAGIPVGDSIKNNGYPVYSFSTTDLAPTLRSDLSGVGESEKDRLLDMIKVVPNPYYAYSDYERSRLDTRVRITNLPKKATVSIYSVDGSLVRKFVKDDATISYLDWDLRNAKGLPTASGMYLIHVNADGLGDRVIKWFGAMRPTDISKFQ